MGTNCQLRIRYLPNDLPRDGYKNKGKLDSYTNKGKLRLRPGLGRAAGKRLPAGSKNHLPAADPPHAVKGLCPGKIPPIQDDIPH